MHLPLPQPPISQGRISLKAGAKAGSACRARQPAARVQQRAEIVRLPRECYGALRTLERGGLSVN